MPGGQSRTEEDVPVQPVVDEDPGPTAMESPRPSGIALPITQVARFGSDDESAA